MDFEQRTRRSFDERNDSPSPWRGRWRGILLLVLGVVLFLCLYSYRVREIGWAALNPSGIIHEGTTNYLGSVGLYIAGLVFWLLGGGAWLLALLLDWFGIYRIVNGGKLPRRLVYWGLGGIVAACVFLSVQVSFWQEWSAGNELLGAGGAVGHLLGPWTLEKLLTRGGLLILSGGVYLFALIYVCGTRPVPLFRGIAREWKAWRSGRAARREKAKEIPAAKPKFNDRFGKPKVPAAAVAPAVSKFKSPSPENTNRKKRTGDALEELDNDSQSELDLKFAPKILDTSRSKPVPAAIPAVSEVLKQDIGEIEQYVLPSLDLLAVDNTPHDNDETDNNKLLETQKTIIETLKSFSVPVTAGNITKGPTITRYEVYPASGLRVSKITNLEQDIARATRAVSINILAPIPGRDTVGIEIANEDRVNVFLRDLLETPEFNSPKKRIPVALGKDVYGNTVIGDLAAMPHLLVAGTTGSGKSFCINSIIVSMLYKFKPDQLKFILVDPKVVEMSSYSTLPHLMAPVVTDPSRAVAVLRMVVNEMERRYRMFAEVGVRNFEAFNNRPKEEKAPAPVSTEPEDDTVDEELIESIAEDFETQGENPKSVWDDDEEYDEDPDEGFIPDRFPYIVIIIDELADLMQTASSDIELYIGRLTQKARAAGIHLIVATQTPRSNVVTGLIKANIPCRIALQVSSALDSRIILDQGGAEKLVGKGDLLYLPPGSAKLDRAQGAYIATEEVDEIVRHCASQAEQDFHAEIQKAAENDSDEEEEVIDEADEDTYRTCLEIVRVERKASTSLLQRRLRIGYGRAARMMDLLERRGVIGPSEGPNKPRDVLV